MVFSKFDSLSVRPPTPPKDIILASPHILPDAAPDETFRFLEDPFGEKPVLPAVAAARAIPSTPAQSPSSDISIPSSTGSRQKRVNFDAQTCAITARKSATPSWTPNRSSPLRALPQTRVEKPLKSCLKLSGATPPPPVDQRAAHTFKTFAEMLESTVKLLASSDRSSRLDAYHALKKTLQAYDKTPNEQALQQKMPLLTQFIRRDMQAASLIGIGLDSQLVAQALKLLMALFRIPELIHVMDEDFCVFVIERGILIAGDASVPKTIVNTHLAVLMQQNFRPKILTAARAEKTLDVLDTITDRVSGFSVQAYRIRIYKRLIQQRPEVMIRNTERWFKHTLKASIASQKDINQSALDTCITAAKQLGHDRHVSKSVVTILNRVRSDGETFAKLLITELEQMLNSDNAHLVPQIWGAITSLLRDSLHGHVFATMREWLQLFERCLVSKQETVRLNTSIAYCILVYSVNLSADTTESWMNMLLNIPLSQLRQRVNTKKVELDAATSSYLTLLYYAFPPNSSFEQMDRCWTAFVARFWSPVTHQSSNAGCQIVTALLSGSRKPWIEHRALDLRPQCMIQRTELPLLDPKWVRKSLGLVLQLVESFLDATAWSEPEQQTNQSTKAMWSAMLDALIEASSKEVMTSSDTKDAMAAIVNLLCRILDKHTTELALSQRKEDIWADKFCFLIEAVVQKLGAAQFTDKCFTRNHDDNLEAASTPPHRSRQQDDYTSPLLYFIDLLVNRSEGKLGDAVRLRALQSIIRPAFDVQNTRSRRLELLRDCLTAVNELAQTTISSKFLNEIGSLLQLTLQTASEQRKSASSDQSQRDLGKDYSIVVDVLGLGCSYFLTQVDGQDVLSTFIDTVRTEAGEGAIILAIIEDVSRRVLNKMAFGEKLSIVSYVSILLRNLPKQMTRRALEQGRQTLWPSTPSSGRSADFDPYKHFYDAIGSASLAAYDAIGTGEAEKSRNFIAAMTSSIQNFSMSHLAVYLRKTQEAVAVWIEDPKHNLHSEEKALKAIHREVIALWAEICRAIERLPRKDGQVLLHLESLMVAGFRSQRRSIVNKSIEMWNGTFGKEESLRYPSCLEQQLRRLRSAVDLSLPSLEVAEGDVFEIAFYDSDSSSEDEKSTGSTLRVKASPFNAKKATRRSISRSPAVAASKNRRATARQTPKARLRHDDSQIQFEPIASSPRIPFDQESQILTDRQVEMRERQNMANGLFANMSAASPQQCGVKPPLNVHSDALTSDDLSGNESTITPAKVLTAMDAMDRFLGSSPTPHARKSAKKVTNQDVDVATPSVSRMAQVPENVELTSSPPQILRSADRQMPNPEIDVQVGSGFGYGQPEGTAPIPFEERMIVDDDAFSDVETAINNDENLSRDLPKALHHSDMPSSGLDMHLTAQTDADIQAHINASRSHSDDKSVSESQFECLETHPQNDASRGAEVQDSQFPGLVKTSNVDLEEDGSSASCVDDAIIRTSSANTTPKAYNLRRSSRQSATSSPARHSPRQRRKSDADKNGMTEQAKRAAVPEKQTPIPESTRTKQQDGDVRDGKTLAVPENPKTSRKRKSADIQLLDAGAVEPESSRRRSMRRTHSLLSQVENSQDLPAEDAPTPKRTRQNLASDVSEAKSASVALQEQPSAQSKRLSHVRVSPRKSSDLEAFVPIPATASATPSPTKKNAEPSSSHNQASQQSAAGSRTPSRSFTERVILTPRSIMAKLRSIKDYLLSTPQLVIGREDEREISSALFDIGRRVHEAGVREVNEENRAE